LVRAFGPFLCINKFVRRTDTSLTQEDFEVANFATDADLQNYEPQILEYGIPSFEDLHAQSTADILRDLKIYWWPKSTMGRYSITTSAYSEMNNDLLVNAQFIRLAVYHVLAHYVMPRLSTFSPDGDVFREKMNYYKSLYQEEFDKILREGVKYDYDSSGTIGASEKQPTHFGRLIR